MARFEQTIVPTVADMDENGHVNNIVYLRWVQEVATAHWRAVALPDWQQLFGWVVLRHEIDYIKPCFAGDEIVLVTWVGAARGARFDRYVEVCRSGDCLARTRTTWVMLDLATQRPARVSAEMIAAFAAGS